MTPSLEGELKGVREWKKHDPLFRGGIKGGEVEELFVTGGRLFLRLLIRALTWSRIGLVRKSGH